MKLNKKHWIALAVAAIALSGLIGAAYWVMTRGESRVERLALDGGPGKQLVRSAMDKIYGHSNYSRERDCWTLTQDYNEFCMKPLALDRVGSGADGRLYLFTSGDGSHEGEGGESQFAVVGAFILKEQGLDIVASSNGMSFVNHDFKGPDAVKLISLSATGDMAWLAEGTIYKSYPQLFAAKDKEVVEITGELFGKRREELEPAVFEYRADRNEAGEPFYPLLLSASQQKGGSTQVFKFIFDNKKWEYVCADDACRERYQAWRDEDSDDNEAEEEPASDAPPSDANAALFDDGNTLSDADLKEVLAALGVSYVIKDQDTWGFVTDKCRTPFRLSGWYTKNHKEDHNEIWIRGGDSCTSGSVGQSIWAFDRDDDGHLRVSFGVPATKFVVVTDGPDSDSDNPYHDIRLSGNGFCESIWRWDGKQYQRLRNEAMQPGGCDREPAAQQ
ncbi:hypothetical protein DK843_14570 [Chromobacterium phragmitis]|uniref:Uncharacterized protein n=1 Tax=Chromobacterium phragmitis TaxID=2202141 RepID=A0A344UJG5_9NEIS|nr:hypothetical protein DK843_14570 [Chromobacterium phragmitis]